MRNILLAGGAGFLGSHLAESLIARSDKVTIVDDLSSGMEKNISGIMDKIKFVRDDIINFDSHEHFDIIINLASRASRREWETYPVEVALTNSLGSNNLIKLALKNSAKYIFASTSEVYGNPDLVPTPEDYVGRISSTGSRSPYDEGKRFGEALTKSYEKEHGLDNTIIRFFNTYGPRMRGGDLYGRVIDRFIQQASSNQPLTVYGDGMQTRSFTYVDDTVNAILAVIDKGKSGEIFNIGNDKETKIIDLANIIIELTGSSSGIEFRELPEHDPLRRAADISRIKTLGWSPVVDLKDGLRKMISYGINP